MSTDAVVPIPCLSTSVIVRSWIARFACLQRVRHELARRPRRRRSRDAARARAETICTAISLATSPAAWPPIPSATMKMPALVVRVDEEVVLVPGADHADVRAGGMDSFTRVLGARRTTAAPTTSASSDPDAARRARAAARSASGHGAATRRRAAGALAAPIGLTPRWHASPAVSSAGVHAGRDEAQLHAAEAHVRRAVEPALSRDRATRRRTCRSSSPCPPRTSHRPAAGASRAISLTLSSVRRTSLCAPRPTWARGVRMA